MTAATMKEAFASAEPVSIWPAPDMSVLTAGRRRAVAMPGDMFGDLWLMIEGFAEGAGSAPDYPALSLLASAASLIGGKRKVQPYANIPQWREPAILWVAGVGDPSSNKSSGLECVMEGPFKRLEEEYRGLHVDALQDWSGDVERAKAERSQWQEAVKAATKEGIGTPRMPDDAVDPDKPQRRRMVVKDVTPEAMASILAGNPAGTLHYRDELSGWLASFDRYAPGGRQFWIEAFGGRPFVIDRKGQDNPISIAFSGVSVSGGIQPDKMADLIAGADDGLLSRFLLAWPEPRPFRRPSRCGDERRLEAMYRRLDGLAWAQGEDGNNTARVLTLASDAADAFDEWARDNDADLDDSGSLFKNFCGKMKGVVLRLSLIIELLQWADRGEGAEPATISARTVMLAADFVEEYAKPMALRTYGDAALPQAERDAAVLAKHILRMGQRQFNARTMRRAAGYPGPKKADDLEAALSQLVEADWIRPSPDREGNTPGRKAANFTVNPGVYSDG
ncbi:DUF3987 domain-containing protein [Pelagerythrobacter sp.]|uniref:DUF3987 domain-containing protein n=1 Tax=Pelagerythrobacter sp. TaxID=2800702 RepID=UPI0035B079C0